MKKQSYLRFNLARLSDSEKTEIHEVYGSSSDCLGTIRWYAPWRRYVFVVNPVTAAIFDAGCLSELIDFIKGLMEARKK